MAGKLRLFEGYGVELEYMIVRRDTLDVLPVTDEVLRHVAGEIVSDAEVDGIGWSNELVLHVIEFKTPTPVVSLTGLSAKFQSTIERVNEILLKFNGRLMPTAMHPWMDPQREMRLWPHEHSPIYEAYDRIFGCKGHGWANLQSVHLNLPFGNDEEFGRLHAAIRVLLPILPAIAASSPVMEMKPSGFLDTRMEVYRHNQRRVPSLAGLVIPERVFTESAYNELIFQRLYRDIAPYDPEGVLQDEFLNSRGAIARFGRGSIEIRVLDIQECPAADIAIVAMIVETLKALVAGRWKRVEELMQWDEAKLAEIFLAVVRDAEATTISNADYLALFGMKQPTATAGELWRHIEHELYGTAPEDEFTFARKFVLEHGTLAGRIVRSLGINPAPVRVRQVYEELCECLAQGRLFGG